MNNKSYPCLFRSEGGQEANNIVLHSLSEDGNHLCVVIPYLDMKHGK